MNTVNLIGRLTSDPEVRSTASGHSVANYTLAVDRPKSQDGTQNADFIRCQAWNKNAEFASKYLSKGMKVGITGSIRTGSYTDQSSGKTIYTTDIVVQSHTFCEKKQDSGQQTYTQQTAAPVSTPAPAYTPQPEPAPIQGQIDYVSDFSDFEEVISEGDLPF